MDSEFEKQLRHQSVKEIPGDWRAEILCAARSGVSAERRQKTNLNNGLLPKAATPTWLSAFFWPHPRAWAGLAAVWVFIFMLNFSAREKSVMVVEKSTPPSPEVIVELKKQQRMYAELVGNYETQEADRPRIFSPKPRSERMEILTA